MDLTFDLEPGDDVVYVAEAVEQIERIERGLLELERNAADEATLAEIFRAAHTLKGSAATIGHLRMAELTHALEEVFGALRSGLLRDLTSFGDLLLPTVDVLNVLVDEVAAGHTLTDAPGPLARGIIDRLAVALAQGQAPVVTDAPVQGDEAVEAPTIATHRSAAHTIRIEVGQLDDLMNIVGELIVQKTRLKHQARQLAARLGEDILATEAEDGARQFAQIIDQLQADVTRLRMLPFETVFNRFPRLVRDLGARLGKDVDLTLDGQETELDRSLLEEVSDPIAHLIRNALDHGIEAGPDRIAAGKSARGSIRVTARHADGRVIVEVADDGRGMDPSIIARAAVERGLIDHATSAEMTDAEALRLVFLPGFSTAREVTSVSGRGVGMDVVKTNVERLGGHVSISSTPGSGTTIAMSLPLTLAIIEALLVRSGLRICAIPLRSVIETQRVPVSDVRTIASRPVLNLPRGVVPLQPLDTAMGDPDHELGTDGFVRAVLVRCRDGDLALGVDALLGTEEIVLKSLGVPGEQRTGVVGATILADGGVALVVDVDRLRGPDRAHLVTA